MNCAPRDIRPVGLAILCCLVAGCDRDHPENEPPNHALRPAVERIDQDHFRVQWEPCLDDTTGQSELRYEVGVVLGPYCIVNEPEASITGQTRVDLSLDWAGSNNPFVGFTVRCVDEEGRSEGYGLCGWATRAPQRIPVAMPDAWPSFPVAECRSDGMAGAWCADDHVLWHYGRLGWDGFPLPTTVPLTDWVPIGENEALARSGSAQLALSRSNGLHAEIISPSSDHFDGAGGAIRTRAERAYVSVRGYVGELTSRHLDFSGPARALRLPDICDAVLQMGYRGELAFGLCRTSEGNILFLGRHEGRLMRWDEPISVRGDRVAGVSGDADNWVAATTDADSVFLYREPGSGVVDIEIASLPGTGPPFAAVAGSGIAPLVILGRRDEWHAFQSGGLRSLDRSGDGFIWAGDIIPADSVLVGTTQGVLAIGPTRVGRVMPAEIQWRSGGQGPFKGTRGRDGRHYIYRRGSLGTVFSTLTGAGYYQHPWRGDPLEASELAVTASGQLYASGLIARDFQRVPTVIRVGSQLGALGLANHPEFDDAPRIAADDMGRLYAADDHILAVYSPALGRWSQTVVPVSRPNWLVGEAESVVVIGRERDHAVLARCNGVECQPVNAPLLADPTGAFPTIDGFCVTTAADGMWCSQGTDATTVPLPERDWRVRDAVRDGPNSWILAVQEGDRGLLVRVTHEGQARELADGFRWAEGAVFVPLGPEPTIVVLEETGPVKLRLRGDRVAIPGRLY